MEMDATVAFTVSGGADLRPTLSRLWARSNAGDTIRSLFTTYTLTLPQVLPQ